MHDNKNMTILLFAILLLETITTITEGVLFSSRSTSTTITNTTNSSSSSSCQLIPTRFRTNNNKNPLAISGRKPVFSWAIGFRQYYDDGNGNSNHQIVYEPPGGEIGIDHHQSAYRIICKEIIFKHDRHNNDNIDVNEQPQQQILLWDSGKVFSKETLQIEYNGTKLRSLQHVQWHVQIWDEDGNECEESSTTSNEDPWFETGLLDESSWGESEWIARYGSLPANTSMCNMMAETTENQVPRFRAALSGISSPSIVEARAYISGLGYYQLYINGQKVGDSMLDPGWTTYSKRVLYSAYNVTSLLLPGGKKIPNNDTSSVVGVELGNGWWNPLPLLMFGRKDLRMELITRQNISSTRPMFRLRIIGFQSDGTVVPLLDSKSGKSSSSSQWLASGSPTTFNNIYLGEKYDARLEPAFYGWTTADYKGTNHTMRGDNTSKWRPVFKADTSGLGRLEAQEVPPIRRQRTLSSTLISTKIVPNCGKTIGIIDTGINHAGSCRFQIKQQRNTSAIGETISLKYGELLYDDGSLNVMTSVAGQIKEKNPSSPCQPDIAYQGDRIIVGSNSIDWTPSWSWHGFRYIEVTVPSIINFDDILIECFTMRSDVDVVSNFSSSDSWLSEDLRQLVKNTYESNLMSIQSDCPHRERFGYGGDVLGCGEAGMSIYDFSSFYRKRVLDYNDAQVISSTNSSKGRLEGFTETAPFVGIATAGLGPLTGPIGWETFQPEVLLWLYKYYGDTKTMTESFQHTHAYVNLLDRQPEGIENGLGDWMAVDGTDVAFTGRGFQHSSYLAFANITEILGMPSNLALLYRQKAARIVDTINSHFMDANGRYHVGTGKRYGNTTQTGQGMALFLGYLSNYPSSRRKALLQLIKNAKSSSHIKGACRSTRKSRKSPDCEDAQGGSGPHITAGLFGIKWVLMALADAGMNDIAYEMVTTKTYPSLGWMMGNPFANATTIWESYYFSEEVMSHNHPMFSSTEVWLLQSIAGIQPHPAAKGMDHLLIKPSPPKMLRYASASYESPRGITTVSWEQSSNSHNRSFELNITIPPNCKATVYIPAMVSSKDRLFHNGALLVNTTWISNILNNNRGSVVIGVGSGRHQFQSMTSSEELISLKAT